MILVGSWSVMAMVQTTRRDILRTIISEELEKSHDASTVEEEGQMEDATDVLIQEYFKCNSNDEAERNQARLNIKTAFRNMIINYCYGDVDKTRKMIKYLITFALFIPNKSIATVVRVLEEVQDELTIDFDLQSLQFDNLYFPTLLFFAAETNDLDLVKALLPEDKPALVNSDIRNSFGQLADDLEINVDDKGLRSGPSEEVKQWIADSRQSIAAW